MPYKTNADLPSQCDGLPDAAKTVWRRVFNANADKGEEHAMAIAWTAVKNGWEKDKDGNWKKKNTQDGVVEIYDEPLILDAQSVRISPKTGYLTAMPRVARSGIQVYRGDELGRPDMEFVRVYRPEAEVFSRDALASYAHKPVTNDHPPEPVTSKNWKTYAKGQTGDEVLRDGTFVRVPMVLMDEEAITDYKNGKRELSQGYSMDLHWESGETEDGGAYDASMRTIRQNHLALVRRARGGPKLRLGDNESDPKDWRLAFDEFEAGLEAQHYGEDEMNELKTTSIMIGDQMVQVLDVSAGHILRTITGMQNELGNLRSKMEDDKRKAKEDESKYKKDAADELTKVTSTKDAEIATLKDQLEKAKPTPQALDALVTERVTVIQQAKALLGDKAPSNFSDKSVPEIRKLSVDSVLGDKAKGWNEDAIAASFNTLAAGVKVGSDNSHNLVDPIRDSFRHGLDSGNTADQAWQKNNEHLQNAWKGATQ